MHYPRQSVIISETFPCVVSPICDYTMKHRVGSTVAKTPIHCLLHLQYTYFEQRFYTQTFIELPVGDSNFVF